MRAVDIITKKRGNPPRPEGEELSPEEIEFLITNYVSGAIPDYQVSAWLMAVYFNGMTFAETAALTGAMLRSGEIFDLHGREHEGLRGPFVDKHSTGGVGDKISLILAPIVAACGLQVPMMAGRALGHTGGTLDKLDSIAGYRTNLSQGEFRAAIARCGFAITGQTREVVPADRLLYALRDVTGTVESVPLITASILSKKAAEGSDALVFDVKAGSGAFMKGLDDAESLARSLTRTAKELGKRAAALITNMDAPLGRKTGNFLEIEETLECLRGEWPADVREITLALAARMLILGGKAASREESDSLCGNALASGRALELFLENIAAQGGNPEGVLGDYGKRRSPHRAELRAERDGFVSVDAYRAGLAGVGLGVGRNRTTDSVCPEAGILFRVPPGERVRKGEVILEAFGKDEACLGPAIALLKGAVTYSEEQPAPRILIYKEIL
ncbi:MAG: thymidine phosphorylase [Spirochaetaceae bacterium]|jgi:pyrimidine-nucleoside phosphorylase|nr:thymidine phosphorylase [Spirochaetaceae bacterium]